MLVDPTLKDEDRLRLLQATVIGALLLDGLAFALTLCYRGCTSPPAASSGGVVSYWRSSPSPPRIASSFLPTESNIALHWVGKFMIN